MHMHREIKYPMIGLVKRSASNVQADPIKVFPRVRPRGHHHAIGAKRQPDHQVGHDRPPTGAS